MAEGGFESIINDIEKEIECGICLQQIKSAKLLNCLHTFCEICLDRITKRGFISCPYCQAITELPEEGVKGLSPNFFFNRIADIVNTKTGSRPTKGLICVNCDHGQTVQFYCDDCKHFLCGSCTDSHKKMKFLSGHNIVDLTKFSSKDFQIFIGKPGDCKKHIKEELILFCEDCKQCICITCRLVEHENHKCLYLQEAAAMQTEYLKQIMEKAEESKSQLNKKMQALEQKSLMVQRNAEQTINVLKASTEKLMQMIRDHVKRVQCDIEKEVKNNLQSISEKESEISANISKVNKFLKFAKDVLNRNCLTEIVELEDILNKRFSELEVEGSAAGQTNSSFVHINYKLNDKVIDALQAIGRVHRSSTQPEKCTFEGDCSGTVDQEFSFYVVTRNENGEIVHNEDDCVSVELSEEAKAGTPIKAVIPVNIEGNGRGKYRVSFVPRSTGKYLVNVCVDDQSINCNKLLTVQNKQGRVCKPLSKRCEAKQHENENESGIPALNNAFVPETVSEHLLDELSKGMLYSGAVKGTSYSAGTARNQAQETKISKEDEQFGISGFVEQSDEEGCETDKIFMEMFHVAYKRQLDDIKRKYNVDIVQYQDKDGKEKVNLKTRDRAKESLISQARSDFICLYQKAHQNSLLFRFSVCREEEERKLRKIVQNIKENIPVVVGKCEDRVSYQLYGDKTTVIEALEKIGSQVKIATDAPEVHGVRSRQGQQSAHFDAEEPMEMEDDPRNVSVYHGSVRISVIKGDITDQRVDAIVNAANENLIHGSGVAGAIIKKGGFKIQEESDRLTRHHGPVKVGDVAVTNPGRLPCKHIIHAVGPMWNVEGKDKSKKLLRRACINSLREAEWLECESIALPAISSGIFGMPKEISAQVMFTAVEDYVRHQTALKNIRFVIIDDPTFNVFRDEFEFYYSNLNNNAPDEKSARNSKENEQRVKKEKRRSQELYSVPTAKQPERDNVSGEETRRSPERYNAPAAKQHERKNVNGIPGQNKAFAREKVSDHPLDEHNKGESGRKLYSGAVKGTSSSAVTAGNPTRERNVSDGDKQFGNQPYSTMTWWEEIYPGLPGYEKYGRIVIDYYFPDGIQGPEHPNPGQRYRGTARRAFLPACKEGWDVLHLLRKAFDAGLVFTVGRSVTSSLDNQIIWNGIHHKTSDYGGPQNYGYPDPTYLSRVKEELAVKGIY